MPFPYVVLDGRNDIAETPAAEVATARSEDERSWFVAHVELNAPRWNNAREALVRSLAIKEPVAAVASAAEQDDAAWDAGAKIAAPVSAAPAPAAKPVVAPVTRVKRMSIALPVEDAPAVAPVVAAPVVDAVPLASVTPAPVPAPTPIKLRPKRRPTLSTTPPMAAPSMGSAYMDASPVATGAQDSHDLFFKEGTAPLVPIPGLGGAGPGVVTWPIEGVLLANAPKPARKSAGRFKKVSGMVLLCGLIAMTGFVLFEQLVPGGTPVSKPATRVAAAPRAPEKAAAPAAAPIAETEPVLAEASAAASAPVAEAEAPAPAPAAPSGPVQASPEFTNFVSRLRVSGVLLGASPRALINGRTVYVGDLIDPVLAVRLVAVDGSARHLVFEDRSTAQVQARY